MTASTCHSRRQHRICSNEHAQSMARSVRLIMLVENRCLLTWRDLVTGSSSGFGRRMTEVALEKGDNVVATLRTPSALNDLAGTYSPDRLRIVQLDVAQSSQIAEVFSQAKAAFGRIDVVFNNAGYIVAGEAETVEFFSADSGPLSSAGCRYGGVCSCACWYP